MNNELFKEYFLTDNQMAFIKNEWGKEYQHNGDGGCLCGYYECYISGIGYLVVETRCRKSSGCPNGMSWIVYNDIQVWSESLSMWGYVPNEDELEGETLKLLGYINKEQSSEIRETVRQSIIRDYSYGNYDEYGNDTNNQIECERNDENILYTLKEVKEAFKEAETSGRDVFDILKQN